MGILSNIYDYFKNTNLDNKLVLLLIVALFLPYQATIVYLIGFAIYIIVTKHQVIKSEMVKKTPGYRFLILTVIYLMLTSLFHYNWLGIANALGAGLIFFIYIFYRFIINRELFSKLIDFILILSVIVAIYGLFEQLYYFQISGELTNYFDISNKPHLRVHAFFFNANFYALILIFVEILCVYKILNTGLKVYYWIGALNLFVLYLTGSRFAWLALGLSLIILAIMLKKTNLLVTTIIVCILLVVLLFFDIPVIPRIAKDGITLERRGLIYQSALIMARDTWLFGVGPLGYQHEWPNYIEHFKEVYGNVTMNRLGISAPHTHNLFLEALVSYGLIGTTLFLLYFINIFKELKTMYQLKQFKYHFSLIITFIIATFLSNILDLPIIWVQTSMIFLLIIGSTALYINNTEKE